MHFWFGVSYPGQDHFQRAISQGMKLLGSATCIMRTQPNHHCIKFKIKNIAHSICVQNIAIIKLKIKIKAKFNSLGVVLSMNKGAQLQCI